MGGLVYYEEIPNSQIPLFKRLLALEMKAFCTQDMDLQPLQIVWAQKCAGTYRQYSGRVFSHEEEIWGLAIQADNIIMLNNDFPANQVTRVTAHECRHFYQITKILRFRGFDGDVEKDANIYADQALIALYYWRIGQHCIAKSYTQKTFNF